MLIKGATVVLCDSFAHILRDYFTSTGAPISSGASEKITKKYFTKLDHDLSATKN